MKKDDRQSLNNKMRTLRNELFESEDHLTRERLIREADTRFSAALRTKLTQAAWLALLGEAADLALKEAAVSAVVLAAMEDEAEAAKAAKAAGQPPPTSAMRQLELPGIPLDVLGKLPMAMTVPVGSNIIHVPLEKVSYEQWDAHLTMCRDQMTADAANYEARKYVLEKANRHDPRPVMTQVRSRKDEKDE